MNARRFWTEAELELLRRNYADSRTDDIATVIDRPAYAVYNKARSLGLKKSDAYLASPSARRLRRDNPNSVAHRFQPGLVPWNKGRRYIAGGRSAETRFKPGRPTSEASNYLPIGSWRISKDGYLERKVTDDPSIFPARRWVGVHRLLWEAAHGPVPAGHVVVFRPGCRTNDLERISLDGLELVTRAELMRRNTYHRYGKEIARAIQLRGAITRQINKRAT